MHVDLWLKAHGALSLCGDDPCDDQPVHKKGCAPNFLRLQGLKFGPKQVESAIIVRLNWETCGMLITSLFGSLT